MCKIFVGLLITLLVIIGSVRGDVGEVDHHPRPYSSTFPILRTSARGELSPLVELPFPLSPFVFMGLKIGKPGGWAHVRNCGPDNRCYDVTFGATEDEVMLNPVELNDREAVVSRSILDPSATNYTWLVLFRKEDTIALFDQWHVGPLLLYKTNHTDIDLGDFDKVAISAPLSEATVDLKGESFNSQEVKQTGGKYDHTVVSRRTLPEDGALIHEL